MLSGFAVTLVKISNPEKTIGEEEKVAFFWKRAALELNKRASLEKCTTWSDELKGKVWCTTLESEKTKGLRLRVERCIHGSRDWEDINRFG
jgi:hypothetical protein